jgi:lysozyme family protein
MLRFDTAVKYVMGWEGGLENNPKDPGGLTNKGISLRFLQSIPGQYCSNDDESRRALLLSLSDFISTKIYYEQFWNKQFDFINNLDTATYLFDMTVNLGREEAGRMAQLALCAHYPTKRSTIIIDGIVGPQTVALLNNIGAYIMPTLRATRVGYYRELAALRPADAGFLKGWEDRAYGL